MTAEPAWFTILLNFFLVLLVVLAVIVVELKDLLYAAIVAGVYGLVVGFLYFMLQAPDIALTQIVVGVGIQTALLVIVISKSIRVEEKPSRSGLTVPSLILAVLLAAILAYAVLYDLPLFGSPVERVGQYYVENVLKDVGAWNAVGAIVWDYRGYDTLGETLVLFTAIIVVLAVFKGARRERYEPDR